jgi:carbon-monoxide dehydrogenase medium subunit
VRPAPFEYIAPRCAEEAVAKLAEHAGDARLLAGGQSLIPLLNLRMARPAALIDLGRCPDLAYVHREGDWISFGPMARQADAEGSPLVRQHCPLLAKALPYLGPPPTRNRGTVCGTLAHADRLAELPAVAVALGAEMIAQGPKGKRTIMARDFFVADLTTKLAPDEMLREVRFPVETRASGCGFAEATIRHHDLMLLGVAARLEFGTGERCMAAQLAVVGGYAVPQRLAQAESHLARAGNLDDAAIGEAARLSVEDVALQGDTYATERYRRRILPALVERAVREALATRKSNAD